MSGLAANSEVELGFDFGEGVEGGGDIGLGVRGADLGADTGLTLGDDRIEKPNRIDAQLEQPGRNSLRESRIA